MDKLEKYRIAEQVSANIQELQTLRVNGLSEIPDDLFFKRVEIHQRTIELLRRLPDKTVIKIER